MESMDEVAFIGRNPKDDPNVYIVTGDSEAGITHSILVNTFCVRQRRELS
jgi:glycine/D-amino acid oxidase-like deaminating enzyme